MSWLAKVKQRLPDVRLMKGREKAQRPRAHWLSGPVSMCHLSLRGDPLSDPPAA